MTRRSFLGMTGFSAGVALAAPHLGRVPVRDLFGAGKYSMTSTSAPIELTLGQHQVARQQVQVAALPLFEKQMAALGSNVSVKVVENTLPDNNYQTLVTERYNAGTAPDVDDYGSNWVPAFAEAGYLLNILPYLSKWDQWQDFYKPVVNELLQPNGKMYGLVHEWSTQQLFYRYDVLTKLGIPTTQPGSWPELIARLQQIKAKTNQPPLIVPVGTQWASPEQGMYNVLLGTGSQLYDTTTKEWVVRSSGVSYVFDLIYTLNKDGLIPTEDLLSPDPWEPTKYKAFVEGTMPVAFQGTWGWDYDWGPTGSAPIPGLTTKVKTWKFPAIRATAKPYVDASDGWAYTVSAKTKYPAEAVMLAEFLSTGKVLAEMLVAVGAASPRAGIDGVAPYSQHPPLLEAEHEFDVAVTMPPYPDQAQADEAWEKAEDGVLDGGMTGTQAASTFAQLATQLIGPSGVVS
jgi:multiple sugar transport system substrate-binding protein